MARSAVTHAIARKILPRRTVPQKRTVTLGFVARRAYVRRSMPAVIPITAAVIPIRKMYCMVTSDNEPVYTYHLPT